MKTSIFLSACLILAMTGVAIAAPEPAAKLHLKRDDPSLPYQGVITLLRMDGKSYVGANEIDVDLSAAAQSPEAWEVTDKDNKPVQILAVYTPKGKEKVTDQINAGLADEDVGKGPFFVRVKSFGGNPAMTLTSGRIYPTLKFEKVNDATVAKLLGFTTPIKPSLSIDGGEDGAILGFKFQWANFHVSDYDILHYSLSAEGNLTPDADDASTFYGHYNAQADALYAAGFSQEWAINGGFFIGPNARFEADQKADNYNGTIGVGTWWFINSKWLAGLGTVFVKQDGFEPEPFSIYLGYDHIITSEYDENAEEQGEDRLRGRLIWNLPLVVGTDLGILPTTYDINLRFDVGGVYDFDQSQFQRDIRIALEFLTTDDDKAKYGFSISYVNGEIAPTFEDEEAFLAGMFMRF